MIAQDFRRVYDLQSGGRLSRLVGCYREPGFHAVVVFRFGHWLLGRSVPVKLLLTLPYLFLHHRIQVKWGILIQRRARIGAGLYVGHYGGIFVSDLAIIGENCSLSQDVTIGVAGDGVRRGAPLIGNNVYVAPGAKLNGKIRIGNNVNVGPNAVVTRNVPDSALVHVRPMQTVIFPGRNKAKDPSAPT
jgi:serine O-acetyltransferase